MRFKKKRLTYLDYFLFENRLAQAAVERSFGDTENRRRKDALAAFIEQGVTKEEAYNELLLQV